MWCGLEFSPHLIFVVTCAVLCIRYSLKLVYFSNFELFLPRQVLNYWASFSLFWVGFSSQHLCSVVRFMQFSYYKTANRTTPCSAVRYTITCDVVRLCHFAGGFVAIFIVCAIYAVWWTPLLTIIVHRWVHMIGLEDLLESPCVAHFSFTYNHCP